MILKSHSINSEYDSTTIKLWIHLEIHNEETECNMEPKTTFTTMYFFFFFFFFSIFYLFHFVPNIKRKKRIQTAQAKYVSGKFNFLFSISYMKQSNPSP